MKLLMTIGSILLLTVSAFAQDSKLTRSERAYIKRVQRNIERQEKQTKRAEAARRNAKIAVCYEKYKAKFDLAQGIIDDLAQSAATIFFSSPELDRMKKNEAILKKLDSTDTRQIKMLRADYRQALNAIRDQIRSVENSSKGVTFALNDISWEDSTLYIELHSSTSETKGASTIAIPQKGAPSLLEDYGKELLLDQVGVGSECVQILKDRLTVNPVEIPKKAIEALKIETQETEKVAVDQ